RHANRHSARRRGHRRIVGADGDLYRVGQPPLRSGSGSLAIGTDASRLTYMPPAIDTTLGTPTASAVLFFLIIVAFTLGVTWWAARRTRSTQEFYAAGRSVKAFENGLALAGDYMSAASFLGIAGLVALRGYDGMIYATGWLVGWPALMFLIAEPLRNLGKYTFADVV